MAKNSYKVPTYRLTQGMGDEVIVKDFDGNHVDAVTFQIWIDTGQVKFQGCDNEHRLYTGEPATIKSMKKEIRRMENIINAHKVPPQVNFRSPSQEAERKQNVQHYEKRLATQQQTLKDLYARELRLIQQRILQAGTTERKAELCKERLAIIQESARLSPIIFHTSHRPGIVEKGTNGKQTRYTIQ
jgi:hypothetical protein